MNAIELQMLGVITEHTIKNGYVPSWEISRAIPGTDDLDVICDDSTPGNAALRCLIDAGLVEELDDLRCRYRLKRGVHRGCAID